MIETIKDWFQTISERARNLWDWTRWNPQDFNHRLDQLDRRIDQLDSRLKKISKKVSRVKDDLNDYKSKGWIAEQRGLNADRVKNKFQRQIKPRIRKLERRIEELEGEKVE